MNYNIKGSQYVIAGELTALEALRLTLDTVCTLKPSDIRMRLCLSMSVCCAVSFVDVQFLVDVDCVIVACQCGWNVANFLFALLMLLASAV